MINVLDHDSEGGTYINGKRIRAKQFYVVKEFDIINAGSGTYSIALKRNLGLIKEDASEVSQKMLNEWVILPMHARVIAFVFEIFLVAFIYLFFEERMWWGLIPTVNLSPWLVFYGLYVVFEIFMHLIFGYSFALWVLGVDGQKSFFMQRILGVWRFMIDAVLGPLIIFDFNILKNDFTLKEKLSGCSILYLKRYPVHALFAYSFIFLIFSFGLFEWRPSFMQAPLELSEKSKVKAIHEKNFSSAYFKIEMKIPNFLEETYFFLPSIDEDENYLAVVNTKNGDEIKISLGDKLDLGSLVLKSYKYEKWFDGENFLKTEYLKELLLHVFRKDNLNFFESIFLNKHLLLSDLYFQYNFLKELSSYFEFDSLKIIQLGDTYFLSLLDTKNNKFNKVYIPLVGEITQSIIVEYEQLEDTLWPSDEFIQDLFSTTTWDFDYKKLSNLKDKQRFFWIQKLKEFDLNKNRDSSQDKPLAFWQIMDIVYDKGLLREFVPFVEIYYRNYFSRMKTISQGNNHFLKNFLSLKNEFLKIVKNNEKIFSKEFENFILAL